MKMKTAAFTDKMILVRGGGDLATGVIHKLHQSGYQVLILECDRPSAIRRHVAFCEAVYDGTAEVEGVVCRRITENDIRTQCRKCWAQGEIPLLTDTHGKYIRELEPEAVIDAILAKKNLGTSRDMAPLTVGLGPGFTAGEDVDYVIETMRGHNLGRIIKKGSALPNTGVPGLIAGIERKWSGDMKLGLIMLAAGNSRRFGSNKLLYGIDGMPMYRHILLELKEVKAALEEQGHRCEITVVTQQRSSACGFFIICIRMRGYLPH